MKMIMKVMIKERSKSGVHSSDISISWSRPYSWLYRCAVLSKGTSHRFTNGDCWEHGHCSSTKNKSGGPRLKMSKLLDMF